MMSYGPLVKYGLIVAAFLAFCVGLIAYGSHRKQQEWDAAIAVQAVHAAQDVIKAAENTARVEREFSQTLHAQAERVKIVTKEVKIYVEGPSKKCPVSPELEHAVDTVSRMLDAPADSVPAATGPPGAIAEPPETQLTDVALLSAYEHAVVELDSLWDTYAALVEWTRSSYELAKEGAGR
jgi:hypothetical protein